MLLGRLYSIADDWKSVPIGQRSENFDQRLVRSDAPRLELLVVIVAELLMLTW